jgi:2-C-methyl-D-erythritol 4-phosphate cytidylyltransferase
MGALIPKQYLYLEGQPVIAHTLKALSASWLVNEIVVAVPPADVEMFERDIIRRYSLSSLCHVVAGGTDRQKSVRNALAALSGVNEIVLVHDGVRPFVTAEEIHSVARAAMEHGAATLGVCPKETVKQIDISGFVTATPDRSFVCLIQTPQAFKLSVLREAHDVAEKDGFIGTDDCTLVERLGLPVKVVEGSYENIKITTADDLEFARLLLMRRTGYQERERV